MLRDVSCYVLLIYIVTHYANEIITESAIITSRARVNFKFSLGAVRLSIIELVSLHVFCKLLSKITKVLPQSTFPDIGAPHVVSIAVTIVIPQNCGYLQ